ncbi:MAG: GTPase ObgE [Candidatus Woykebacteria bacterium]
MIDYVKIRIRAGDGGDGHVSFRRLKGKAYGPPEGGNGGDGGNLFIKATRNLSTLLPYRYKKDFDAQDGVDGGKSDKQGAKGEDLVLEVPVGTLVNDDSGSTIIDMVKNEQKELLALGGKGGRGNSHLKRSDIPKDFNGKINYEALKHAEKGSPGEQVLVTLELKLLADIGLVGLPSSGKSTLLSKLTSAKPKISPYPFTTLEPNLGVMHHKGKELVIADIPGLIEGASKGKGLGDQFLRHVERTRALVHLVSAESQDPFADITVIKNELSEYSKKLSVKTGSLNDKPVIIVMNKIDILIAEDLKNKIDQFKKYNIEVISISSVTGEGLEELKDELIKLA